MTVPTNFSNKCLDLFSNEEDMIAVFNENVSNVDLNDKEIRLKHK